MTLNINDTQHKWHSASTILSITMICHYAECHILLVLMLSVFMLSVVILSVIMLSVVLLSAMAPSQLLAFSPDKNAVTFAHVNEP